MRLVLIAVMVLLVSGCANRQTMSRAESIEATKRTYDGVNEEQFYAAAKRLFELSDESDYRFSYPGEHAMIAQRSWTIYMVLAFTQGTHTWRLQTEDKGGAIEATVHASAQASGVSGAPTGAGGASTITTPAMQNIVNTPAVYELFWARLDYLLNNSESWPTCDMWSEKIDSGGTYGNIEHLCLALNTDDRLPGNVPPSPR